FTPDDVFPPLGPWRELLVSLAAGHLQNNDRLKPLLRSEPGLEAAVQQSALQPSNWTLTVNGLTITFPLGMVASDAAGTPRVYIPWEELKPYLEPTLNPSPLPPPPPPPASPSQPPQAPTPRTTSARDAALGKTRLDLPKADRCPTATQAPKARPII